MIYHNGRCLYTSEDLQTVRNNATFFYSCQYKEPNYVQVSDQCSVINDYTKRKGVYINENDCVRYDGNYIPEKLFDIPVKLRRTGKLFRNK